MWKIIPIDNNYEANELGDIRRINSNQLCKQWLDKDGYKIVALTNKKIYRAHRLIALTFIENPEGYPIVNHKNHNKHDNRVENLEWTTYSYNSKHSYFDGNRDNGTKEWVKQVQPKAAEASKTKVRQYDLDGNLLAVFSSQREAAEKTGTCRSSITRCCTGKRKTAGGYKWNYLESSTTKQPQNLADSAEPLSPE